jgi:hypothetical protein
VGRPGTGRVTWVRMCPVRSNTERTSRSALTVKTPYVMARMPPRATAVFVRQFEGCTHQPPACSQSWAPCERDGVRTGWRPNVLGIRILCTTTLRPGFSRETGCVCQERYHGRIRREKGCGRSREPHSEAAVVRNGCVFLTINNKAKGIGYRYTSKKTTFRRKRI